MKIVVELTRTDILFEPLFWMVQLFRLEFAVITV